MNKTELQSILFNIESPLRIHRKKAVNIVLEHPELVKDLIKTSFNVDAKESIKACWVLEWICTHNSLDIILPYLDFFTKNISKVHFVGTTRACAKICEHLAIAYTNKKENLTKEALTQKHINRIVETGFDWLITEQKIAVKAYTMQTLYLFGLNIDWIHSELAHIIRTKVIHQSKGCEARGKKILALIEKHS